MSATPINLTPEMIQQLRERSKRDLYFFCKGVLGFSKLVPAIHLPICRMLQDQSIKRTGVMLMRSGYKSTVATIGASIWDSINNPEIRILIVQNSATNARKKLAAIRAHWESNELLRILFPELVPDSSCVWTSDGACLRRKSKEPESTYEIAGTKTKITSRHYDKIVEDDTVAPDLDDMTADVVLPTREDIEQAIGFHRNCLPLLVDIKESRMVVVGTRWATGDLLEWVMNNETHYKWIKRAVRETGGLPDEEGQVIWPERFDEEALRQLRVGLGDYLFSCLYMNLPLAATGMVFQSDWIRYYETLPGNYVVYTTVDLASDPEQTKGNPDYNVVMSCAKDLARGTVYVLDYFRARCGMSEVIQQIFEHVRRYHPLKVGIEAVGYQSQMVKWVKERMREEQTYFMVEPLKQTKRSKASRINGLEPFVKSGQLMFRTHHRVLVSELLSMSRDRGCLSKNDDCADALSMQIQMWALTRTKAEEAAEGREADPMSFDAAETELIGRRPRGEDPRHAWSDLVFS